MPRNFTIKPGRYCDCSSFSKPIDTSNKWLATTYYTVYSWYTAVLNLAMCAALEQTCYTSKAPKSLSKRYGLGYGLPIRCTKFRKLLYNSQPSTLLKCAVGTSSLATALQYCYTTLIASLDENMNSSIRTFDDASGKSAMSFCFLNTEAVETTFTPASLHTSNNRSGSKSIKDGPNLAEDFKNV